MSAESRERPEVVESSVSDPHGEPLSWPLVERRRGPIPLDAPDRRTGEVVPGARRTRSGVFEVAPLAPFRIVALAGAVARGFHDFAWRNWNLTTCTAIVVAYTAFIVWRPVAHFSEARSRTRTVVDAAIITGVVTLSGGWASPFTLCLVPTAMLASFVGGTTFSAATLSAASLLITLRYFVDVGASDGFADSVLWIGLLSLVTATSGLSFRAAQASATERQQALDRVGKLAEANALLFSLQRVAQTLPASLDLEDVLDATVNRVQALLDAPLLTILLVADAPDHFETVRAVGHRPRVTWRADDLPPPLDQARAAPKPIQHEAVGRETGQDSAAPLALGARSGIYAAMRARGSLVGLIAVESADVGHFGPQQAEVLHGLTEPFGIAIDNAKLFHRLRSASANEERNRIARDLHDHIGSSLASFGFEIDLSIAAARRGESVEQAMRDLRAHVTAMIGEVRETLYDLRSEISESRDLAATIGEFVERLRSRSGIEVAFECDQQVRRGLTEERELWHVTREALINVERHAQATQASVEWRSTASSALLVVRDNGVGIVFGSGRIDSYGLRGMRERVAGIGAQMTTESSPTGTVIRVLLQNPTGARRWD